jgi:hypothetical protein
MPPTVPATLARVERAILRMRGHNVVLDVDLAALYGVTTKRFNEQVRRNLQRFPADFMFQLTPGEYAHGGRRHVPYVFSEHGAIMAATVLNSRRAVEMSITSFARSSGSASCSSRTFISRGSSMRWSEP